MANVTSIQILEDGDRNVIAKLIGRLDTSNVSLTTLLDPATLASVNTSGLNPQKASTLAIETVTFDIEDGLVVGLYWDADTDVPAWYFSGRDKMNVEFTAFLQNNAGAGKTGKILYDTSGWTTGTKSFSMVIQCVKQWT
jgi:hypothetical protein